MIRFQQWLGNLMNAVGAPGFLRDTDFRSKTFGTHVRVKRGQLFTVVSINGLDVYFSRFTGNVDGVGFSPTYLDTPASMSQSTLSPCSAALIAQLDSALTRSPMQPMKLESRV
jgi:hypothetical protein